MKKILLILSCILLVACQAETEETLKIGFINPLTGDVSSIGQAVLDSAELAVKEINAAGGVNGQSIVLLAEDSNCDARMGASAGQKLIEVENVDYIVGAGCSGATLAVAPLAEANEVIMISPLSSSPDISEAGDYIFRNYVKDTDAATQLSTYVTADGYEKVALLWSLNDYSQALGEAFKNAYEGEIVLEESFEQGSTDLRNILTKVKQSDAEAVVLFEYTQGVITYFKQAEELGIDVQVYGADTYTDADIIAALGETFEGTRFILGKDVTPEAFKTTFMEATGRDDLKIGVPQAYDNVYILKQAIEAVGDDTTAVKEYLYSMEAYQGVSGSVAFDSKGDLISPEFELLEIQDGEAVVVG